MTFGVTTVETVRITDVWKEFQPVMLVQRKLSVHGFEGWEQNINDTWYNM